MKIVYTCLSSVLAIAWLLHSCCPAPLYSFATWRLFDRLRLNFGKLSSNPNLFSRCRMANNAALIHSNTYWTSVKWLTDTQLTPKVSNTNTPLYPRMYSRNTNTTLQMYSDTFLYSENVSNVMDTLEYRYIFVFWGEIFLVEIQLMSCKISGYILPPDVFDLRTRFCKFVTYFKQSRSRKLFCPSTESSATRFSCNIFWHLFSNTAGAWAETD